MKKLSIIIGCICIGCMCTLAMCSALSAKFAPRNHIAFSSMEGNKISCHISIIRESGPIRWILNPIGTSYHPYDEIFDALIQGSGEIPQLKEDDTLCVYVKRSRLPIKMVFDGMEFELNDADIRPIPQDKLYLYGDVSLACFEFQKKDRLKFYVASGVQSKVAVERCLEMSD